MGKIGHNNPSWERLNWTDSDYSANGQDWTGPVQTSRTGIRGPTSGPA